MFSAQILFIITTMNQILTENKKIKFYWFNILKQKIKKYSGELFLITGSFMTVYNIFNWEYFEHCGGLRKSILTLSLDTGPWECKNPVISYYYSDETRFYIALGLSLLILGLIIIKKNKKLHRDLI